MTRSNEFALDFVEPVEETAAEALSYIQVLGELSLGWAYIHVARAIQGGSNTT